MTKLQAENDVGKCFVARFVGCLIVAVQCTKET